MAALALDQGKGFDPAVSRHHELEARVAEIEPYSGGSCLGVGELAQGVQHEARRASVDHADREQVHRGDERQGEALLPDLPRFERDPDHEPQEDGVHADGPGARDRERAVEVAVARAEEDHPHGEHGDGPHDPNQGAERRPRASNQDRQRCPLGPGRFDESLLNPAVQREEVNLLHLAELETKVPEAPTKLTLKRRDGNLISRSSARSGRNQETCDLARSARVERLCDER